MLLDVFYVFFSIVFAGKTVGVVAVGQEQHFYVHTFLQQHIDTAQRGFDAGGVAVVEHCQVVGEAVDEAYLLIRKRCA